MSVGEHWKSVDQISTYLGVSKETIYRWLSKKTVPAHKVGRLWKFKLREVDDWVRSGCASSKDLHNNKTRSKV